MVLTEINLEGKVLGDYKIIKKIGKGGMASVYKAHENSLNRVVALKVMNRKLIKDDTYVKRFRREAQAAAILNHPNIVQIYSISEDQGFHFFAMEYVKGETLLQFIQKQGPVKWERAVDIIRVVCEALSAAHRAGLVHRDVKPANIMISEHGDVKVTDFGIAHVNDAATKLTSDGSIIGTPEYLSPEQCEGKTVDLRSDIYSLGVTLYEILSGDTPYEADTPVSVLMKIAKGNFEPIAEKVTGLPSQVVSLVEKMMEKDPDKRYQSAEDLIADIDRLKISAQKYDTVEGVSATKQYTKKSNAPAALIVLAVILALLGGAYGTKIFLLDSADKEVKSEKIIADPEQKEIEPGTDIKEMKNASVENKTVSGEIPDNKAQEGRGSEGEAGQATAHDIPVENDSDKSKAVISDVPDKREGKRVKKIVKTYRKFKVFCNREEPLANAAFYRLTEILKREGMTVFEESADEGGEDHFVVDVKLLGTRTLSYYGSSSEQKTWLVSCRVVDPVSKEIVAGPASGRVSFTELNRDERAAPLFVEIFYQVLNEYRGKFH